MIIKLDCNVPRLLRWHQQPDASAKGLQASQGVQQCNIHRFHAVVTVLVDQGSIDNMTVATLAEKERGVKNQRALLHCCICACMQV